MVDREWNGFFMSAVAVELERMLTRLKPEAAEKLEMQVREALSSVVESDKVLPTLEEMKLRMPEFAEVIGCWAEVEFELPPDLPLPPAKIS